MKLPAYQFYPGDWRKDPGVQALNYHDRGVWHEMICLMHESEQRGLLMLNGRAMPDEVIARMLGLDNQILTTTLTTLLTYGVASRDESTGAVMSRRMVRDEKLRQIRKECGKQGGNPNLVNQKPTTKVKQISTPSSSSSTSSSDITILKDSKAKGSLDELKSYAVQIGLKESDGESMFDHWTANGWKNGQSKSRDWKAGMRKWKSQGWMPSQKTNGAKPKHAGISEPDIIKRGF